MAEIEEGLGVPKSTLTEFMEDLKGRLTLLTGIVNYTNLGLTIEQVRKPMLIIGKPGIGKTAGILGVIKELNAVLPAEKKLGFKKILLGQTVVGSLSGIPVHIGNGEVVRVQMPDLPNEARDGKYGVLFLDEITTADEMQIQPALGLADDSRNIGEYSLPEGWIVVGAGNGPDCTNFVRLDDMTLTRFTCYDVAYNYNKDFRPYAHAAGISPDIIAFLNFDPESCVRVESGDLDSAGKMFPCPRTWERLSVELQMRQVLGKGVSTDQLSHFAGRIVGTKAGNAFSAFMMFKDNLGFSPEKIFAGEEKPAGDIQKESFHLILQACIKKAQEILDNTVDSNGDYPLSTYEAVANMVRWFLSMEDLEYRINTFTEIKTDIPILANMMFDEDFNNLCPELDEFISENSTLLLEVL